MTCMKPVAYRPWKRERSKKWYYDHKCFYITKNLEFLILHSFFNAVTKLTMKSDFWIVQKLNRIENLICFHLSNNVLMILNCTKTLLTLNRTTVTHIADLSHIEFNR